MLKPTVSKILEQIILSKLSEKEIIHDSFKEVKSVLSIVKDGFEFLNIFIRQIHPVFCLKLIIAEKIPDFSDYGEIYKYCKGIQTYFFRHDLNGTHFNQLIQSKSFIYYLDNPAYELAKQYIIDWFDNHKRTSLVKPRNPPPDLKLENLLGYINKLQEKLKLYQQLHQKQQIRPTIQWKT